MAEYTLEKFECEGEVGSVSIRWERWKRSLSIYLEAAGIDTDAKKRASLLHFGGPELQEIFYNIPGANVTEGELFNIAIEKLDKYFAPKQSKVYERHMFRLLKQEQDEKFEKFLIRLRLQAKKCQFGEKEGEHIIDQITEKGRTEELRKKILKTGDKISLDEIIAEANALEAIDRQLENFGTKLVDKLPMIQDTTHLSDLEMKDRDKALKEKGKEYADRKRRATSCQLEIGDKVCVKNMTKQNKLSPNYEPGTHTVEANKGGDVSLRNDETGQQIRRNVVHLKRVEGQWKVLDDENNRSEDQTKDDRDVNQPQLE